MNEHPADNRARLAGRVTGSSPITGAPCWYTYQQPAKPHKSVTPLLTLSHAVVSVVSFVAGIIAMGLIALYCL